MSVALVGLAALMGLVTYPSRALPLLVPGIERMPRVVLDYLRLIGPAVLATIGAVNVLVVRPDGEIGLHIGIEAAAVVVCLVLTLWRKTLLLGLVAAVALVAIVRAVTPA